MNGLKTVTLLAVMTALLAALGWLLDRVLGTGGLMMSLFFGLGIIMNWVSYFYSDKMVLKMYHAREVSPSEAPELHRIIDRLVARTGLPKPKVCIIPTDVPNAFATGRNPQHAAVAATEGILRALTPEELEGVMAHEMAHVKNRDTLVQTVAATIAGAIGMLATAGQWGAMFGMGGHGDDEDGAPNPLFSVLLIVFALLAPILATLAQLAISRTREFGADRAAAEFTKKPEHLASALRRLESFAMRHPAQVPAGTQHLFIINPLSGGQRARNLFSTHPSTEARVQALREIQAELQSGEGSSSVPPPLPPRASRF